MGPIDEYNNSVSKQKRKRQSKKQRILVSDSKEHGADSLYDEKLLNELNKNNDGDVLLEEYRDSQQPQHLNLKYGNGRILGDEEDPDSSSSSSSDDSSCSS